MRKFCRLWPPVLAALLVCAPLSAWSAASDASKEKAADDTAATGETKGEKEEGGSKAGEAPATFGPLITDTAVPMDKGKWAVQPTIGLSFFNRSFDDSWKRVSSGGDFKSLNLDVKLTYGLWDNLEVFTVISYIQNWASGADEPGPGGETAANSGGIGDVNLTLKYRFIEETALLPTVTALFSADFPAGKFKGLNPANLETEVIGGGSYVPTVGLNVSKYVAPVVLYGNIWYSMPTDFKDDDGTWHPRDFVTVNLAAEYPFTEKWIGLLELTSYWDGGRLFGRKADVPQSALFSVLPGIEYMATEKLSFALGVNVDLIGKNTDATVAPMISMVYAF